MKKPLCSMVAMAAVACGGPVGATTATRPTPTPEVSGTIAGAKLIVADGILSQQTSDGLTLAYVVLTDMENACDTAKANKDKKGAAVLGLTLGELKYGASAVPTAGKYNIVSGNGMPSGKFAYAVFKKNAADSCTSAIDEKAGSASSGKVTVTKYDAATGAEGTFELNFSAGEKVTGSFDVASCTVTTTSTTAPTCE